MISLIFATDPNHLIGKDNDLPWNYSEDLKYFKAKTLNKTVLMGLETFNSILSINGKPLPRRNLVVASLEPFSYPNVTVIDDLFKYLKQPHEEEIFIIGGKTIYELSFPYADRLYITHIKKEHKGNVYLNFNLDEFTLVSEDIRENLIFAVYERLK
ncbi:MAG: dihydrofolate reductase [Tenericutes bacterium]|nr:dihydrofolate reductase [Mycoplasmatota bacterium]